MYIYDYAEWPNFTWDERCIADDLAPVKFSQGMLLGRMQNLGMKLQEEAFLEILTTNIIKTSEIEGEHLNSDEVRSSIATFLGIDIAGLKPADRSVNGIVEMHLDATRHYDDLLTVERLSKWHTSLFPTSLSGMMLINPGYWRNDSEGPMQVVSGSYGREKVHYRAPSANRLVTEINQFLAWFNRPADCDLLIKSGIAHLWFVTLHPFEDGNGRIARAIADMVLARSDNEKNRYYSLSRQIRQERKSYYEKLEYTQKHGLDITPWLIWYLGCLDRAIKSSEDLLQTILNKAKFWEQHRGKSLNERQIIILNILFDGFKGKLSSSKWAKITKCSQDTATRDITMLVKQGILIKGSEGGRSTHYILKDYPINYID